MTNKSTKRALLSSVMALFLCFAMLLGTTFAWFTDSVESGTNKIVAGNLDVELKYATVEDGNIIGWNEVKGQKLFDPNALWEPGRVEVVYLEVSNLGTLALKYQLGVNITGKTIGKSVLGNDIDLTNYLNFKVVPLTNEPTVAYTREEAVDALGATRFFSDYNGVTTPLEVGGTDYVALVVYMPTTVGNEANYDKTYPIPSIEFGVSLFATQVSGYEEDSFGPDYDFNAPIVSAPVARPDSAVILKGAEGVTVALSDDFIDALPTGVTEIGMSVSEPKVVGNTIVFDTIELLDQNGEAIDLESLNLAEKVTVTLPAQSTFDEGEIVMVYHDDEFVAAAVVGANGVISYDAEHFCEVTIGKAETPAVNENNVLEISTADQLFGFAQSVNAGVTYEGVTVKLTKDIDLKNSNWTPIGSATQAHGFMGNFDGNDKTIYNLCINDIAVDADGFAYAGFFGVTEGIDKDNQNYIKNLKIENVTINTKGDIVSAAIAYPYYTAVENITVCGDIAIKGGEYTAGVLAYTRRCVDAKNIVINGNEGSYITGTTTVGGVISDIQMNGGLIANYSNFSASNLTITGDKCVGGISGIIGGQTLTGATVQNVTLVCDDAHVGIVSGSYDTNPVINGVKYSNVTGATAIAGIPYKSSKGVQAFVVDGVEYVSVSTADELVEALENKKNVLLINDIKIDPANMSNAYGKTGINVKYGQIIDGNGNTLNIKGAGGTWDSGINTTGGLIKNITVTGSFRGIFINHTSEYSEKVVLENVVIGGNGTVYTISCDQGLYQGIEATNCTFNGWTSFAKTAGEAKFVNCTFGEGSGYKYCRPYSNTEFVNCTFCEGYAVDTTRATVTFTDCSKPN